LPRYPLTRITDSNIPAKENRPQEKTKKPYKDGNSFFGDRKPTIPIKSGYHGKTYRFPCYSFSHYYIG
jgi:hypothetical protein